LPVEDVVARCVFADELIATQFHNRNKQQQLSRFFMDDEQPAQIICQPIGTIPSINYLWNIWNLKTFTIPNTKYSICGYSVAAQRTSFYSKELNAMFDSGLSSNYSPDHIFVTHMHTDHRANLPFNLSYNGMKTTYFYAPLYTKQIIKNYIDATNNSNVKYEPDKTIFDDRADFVPATIPAYEVVEADDGTFLNIDMKGKPHLVEIINSHHSIRCISFGLIETKNKLKPEYKTKTRDEIIALKKANVEIMTIEQKPYFIYVGDTSKEILSDPRLLKYSTIMIECTFIADDELERADKTKHIHWKSLEPFVVANPQITFVLYHFSSRYKKVEIDTFFEGVGLRNVIVWNCN
jgi:ribonuclease BN (tRNA processing enzyme)